MNDTTVQDDLKLWPFEVVAVTGTADATKPRVVVTHQCEDKQYTAEEITAMVLKKMKENAEASVGSTVKSAVLTVPAHFNEIQRQAIGHAGVSAGFNAIQIISEPQAVATAYSLHKKCYSRGTLSENVLIFDLGGGTLDVSLIRSEDYHSEVKAVRSDTSLGGRYFDNRLVNHFVEEIRNKFGKDISGNPKYLAKLRTSCVRAKKLLSSATETNVEIDLLGDGIEFSSTLTRELFEELNSDLFMRCMDCIEKCLEDGKVNKNDVHSFALVGGSTKIPKIQEMLKEYFKGKEICQGIDPDTAVATGAAIISAFRTTGDGNDDIKCLIGNVTPLSLEMKKNGVGISIVLPKNSTPALKKKGNYTTHRDNETKVVVEVYEDEGKVAMKKKYRLGKITLTRIPPAPKGVPIIEVYFDFTLADLAVLTVTVEHHTKQVTIANPISSKAEKKRPVKGPVSKMLKKIQKSLQKVF